MEKGDRLDGAVPSLIQLAVTITHAMESTHFNQNLLGPRFTRLLADERLAPLGPGEPNLTVRAELAALQIDTAFEPRRVVSPDMAQAVLAGIWLYHDFLDESHRISQHIATPTGSFWHGILHRREPDSGNSKYWFQRVGSHPLFPALCARARALADKAAPLAETAFLREQEHWNPFLFIELCEASRLGSIPAETLCREIQKAEWQLLFEFCYRQAIGLR